MAAKPGVSSTLLLELLRVHLAVHGEFITCALMQRALESHQRVCDSAARLQQDVVNDVSDDAAALLFSEVARLRLEAERCGLRAHQLASPIAIDDILTKLEEIARLERECVRSQRRVTHQEIA